MLNPTDSLTPKIECSGPAPCSFGIADPLEVRPSLTRYHAEFGHSRSNGTSIKEIRLNNIPLASHLSMSLKVIRTDTDQSVTYDFLLTFHPWAYLVPFQR